MNASEPSRPDGLSGTTWWPGHASTGGATRPHTDEALRGNDDAPAPRSPLRQSVLLLAIYVAMYGTVGLLVHIAHPLANEFAGAILQVPAEAGTQRAHGRIPRPAACAPVAEEQRCVQG